MLRIEFEQNLAANEQTGPINKEMRNLITSLQTHNVQLKGEVARYKRKYTEKGAENVKLQRECADLRAGEIKALQAKKEVARYKRKYTEKGADNVKLQRECA